jgi:hypothetical protein
MLSLSPKAGIACRLQSGNGDIVSNCYRFGSPAAERAKLEIEKKDSAEF